MKIIRRAFKKYVFVLKQKNFLMLMQQPGEQIRPNVTLEDAKKIASQLYGLNVKSIKCLNSYEDKNYLVEVSSEHSNPYLKEIWPHGYTLKVLNSLESRQPEFSIAQNQLMEFLHKQNISCPLPVPDRNHNYYSLATFPFDFTSSTMPQNADYNETTKHVVRLLTYIPGNLFHDIKCTNENLFELGTELGKLHEAMKNFYHPAFDIRKTIWSLNCVSELTPFMHAVKNSLQRTLIKEVIEQFTESVEPVYEDLPKGLIHGDYNEQNILMQCSFTDNEHYKVCGILDFADVQRTCYVFDVAIALAYMMIQGKHLGAIQAGGHFLAGYIHTRPLCNKEWNVLKVCIAARLCQSLVLGSYNYLLYPDNEYLLVTQKDGWDLLNEIWITPQSELIQTWNTIINSLQKEPC